MFALTSKLGEINGIEHNKGSKIYPQNQVILDCCMPSLPLAQVFKYHSDMGHCFSLVVSKKSKIKKMIFFLLNLIGKSRHGIGKKVAIFDWE